MIVKWIQSLTHSGQADQANAAKQADEEERKKRKGTKLVDIAHEAMAERAAKDSDDLQGLVQIGWPNVQREKFKGKVRQRVWNTVSRDLGSADSNMIDEVTERIVAAAEVDPFYKKMFEKE